METVWQVRARLAQTGHGRVVPREDGNRFRCFGPPPGTLACGVCAKEQADLDDATLGEAAASEPEQPAPPSIGMERLTTTTFAPGRYAGALNTKSDVSYRLEMTAGQLDQLMAVISSGPGVVMWNMDDDIWAVPSREVDSVCVRRIQGESGSSAERGAVVVAPDRVPQIWIHRPTDERIEVYVGTDPVPVATASHDEHGHAGMDLLESAALKLARAFGAQVAR